MHASTVAFVLAALAACNRIEEPQHSAAPRTYTELPQPRATPVSAAAPPEEVPARVASPCPVALPDTPPPAATAAATCPKEPGAPPSFGKGTLRFVDAPSTPSLALELATDARTHEHGLMYRTELPEDRGMLFSWPNEQVRAFWMMNTCIPLDMLFIAADRTILGILEEVPVLNRAERSVPCPAAYVLEVNAGYSRRHGIKPGMHVEIQ